MKLIQNISGEKLRGGFYTPSSIANFILRWAVNGNENFDILEPSCGDGIFLKEIKNNKFKYNSITAIEIDKEEANKSSKINLLNTKILNQDFYKYLNSTNDRFDLIVGNPPYIRYQYFLEEQRLEAEKIFEKTELKYSKLMNAWVSFVIGCSLLLKRNGRIGFVIPAELLQVSYAKQLRNFLSHFYNKINIISFRRLVFPKVQQEIILLLCEKNESETHLIEHLEIENTDGLEKIDVTQLKSPKKKIDFKSNKWTFYFLEQDEINFIEKLFNQREIKPMRYYASIEVGMTTGDNKFFTVPSSTVKKYNLLAYSKPMVGRSVQVPSLIFNKKDWEKNVELGARAQFLYFPLIKEIKGKPLEYIKEGESLGINKGYKCGIREEWQIVPSAWVSDALFIRRNNIYPKLIVNEVGAYTTDTMHRVKIKKDTNLLNGKGVNLNAFVASYYNSLSLAFAEICGRSHGGGVLELMPNEAENILLPYNEKNEDVLSEIDKMMREGKNIDDILKYTDKIILKERLGFSDKEIKLVNGIWKKLLQRRLARNGH